jgi:hypothetical protein
MRQRPFLTAMPVRPLVRETQRAEAAVDAMRTADRLFAASSDGETLLTNAAEALASGPGTLCLISIVGDDAELRPVVVAHATNVQNIHVSPANGRAQADAFSRSVQRTGRSLRMRISQADLLHLWLPVAWLAYAERVSVSSVLAAAVRHPRRGVLATLLLWREGDQAAFDAHDEAYVAAVAERLALGISTYLT